jgi:hypothetical protein
MKPSATDTSDVMTLQIHRDNSARASTATVAAEAETSAPPAEATAEATPEAPPCPRCGGKLTNPEGLGWCPSCGYCRSLEQDAKKAALAAPATPRGPSPLGVVEFVEVLGKLPRWFWVLLGGTSIVVGISVAANSVLPDDSLARALWSSVQLGLGLVGMFAAQIWAFLLVAPETEHLSAKDLILSTRLWSITCRRLPETQAKVWLGAWSFGAGLCAVFLVGGFSYWYQFYKPKKIADRSLIEAIANQAQKLNKKNKSMEEALEDLTKNAQDLTKKKDEPKKDAKDDKRAIQDCVIIGYTVVTDQKLGKDRVTSLVVATLIDGKIKLAGVVRRGFDQRSSDELLKRLVPLVQKEPFVRGVSMEAIWVKPQVFCEVHQSGFDRDGRLKDPSFKDLLTEQ